MKTEKMNHPQKKNVSSLLIVLSILVCIGLLGVSFARYIANEKHKENANLADFHVQVLDLETMEPPDWDIEIPATTRLYDDTHFDDVVIDKRLMITNLGDQTVKLGARLIDKITSDNHNGEDATVNSEDIFIFAFNYDVQNGFQAQIQAALDSNLDAASAVSAIKTDVDRVTGQNLENWSYDLKPGESRFLTVLVWRENTAVNDENSFGKTVYLKEHLELDVLQK